MKINRFIQFILIALFSYGCALLPTSIAPGFLASSQNSDILIESIYVVRPDILAIEISTGEVTRGGQIPYESEEDDKLIEDDDVTWVVRNRETLGALVGRDRKTLYALSQYSGPNDNLNWLEQESSYQITSQDDQNYSSATSPDDTFRKVKPTDMVQTDQQEFVFPKRHILYLKLPQELTVGKTYQISLPNQLPQIADFQYQPKSLHSEAIHVSHIGFRPDDPAKIGFLSTWMGTGSALGYQDNLPFWVQDSDSHSEVYRGLSSLSKVNTELEDPYRNYSGTDVYLMDFSDFKQPGNYQLCVEGIGCSFAFKISEESWENPFYISARGFYHQRSGIELEEPYTSYYRPRSFHPDDGFLVYETTVSLMETNMGLNVGNIEAFKAIEANQTDTVVPDAWGGYMDAGDWDRRIQHLGAAQKMLELVDLFPAYFSNLSLNIPESNNDLPDIIDEALWGIDLFKRIQTPEGGIRGGIESLGHPQFGAPSWQESQKVFAYAPDVWSSYIYAGVAARAAYVLKEVLPDLVEEYQSSALRAMAYAEAEYAQAQISNDQLPFTISDQRNLAAVELWRLTEDEQWHELFLETTAFSDPKGSTFRHRNYEQRDAAFVYARLPESKVQPTIQNNVRSALIQDANQLIEWQNQTAFKWGKSNSHTPVSWGGALGTPQSIAFLHAHALTRDESYLEAAVLAAQFSAGANPDNIVYTTGVGHRSPKNPLIVDQRVTGQDAPPGITVYGPSDLDRLANHWFLRSHKEEATPSMFDWPSVESYFDVYRFVPVNEFTIHQTMVPTMYTWGYLSARP